jgi:hypothetical protein
MQKLLYQRNYPGKAKDKTDRYQWICHTDIWQGYKEKSLKKYTKNSLQINNIVIREWEELRKIMDS